MRNGNFNIWAMFDREIFTIGNDSFVNRGLLEEAENGNLNSIKYLITIGADVNAFDKSSGMTALHHAARQGHKEIVDTLVQAGANVKAADNFGNTVLHYAARQGHKEILDALIKAGANVKATDDFGNTVLHGAAHQGHKEIIDALVQTGVNVNAADNSGNTVLHYAARQGHKEAVDVLITAGANIDAADNSGDTALHAAAYRHINDMIITLLEKGAQIKRNDDGENILHIAISWQNVKLLEAILNTKKVSAKDIGNENDGEPSALAMTQKLIDPEEEWKEQPKEAAPEAFQDMYNLVWNYVADYTPPGDVTTPSAKEKKEVSAPSASGLFSSSQEEKSQGKEPESLPNIPR